MYHMFSGRNFTASLEGRIEISAGPGNGLRIELRHEGAYQVLDLEPQILEVNRWRTSL